MDVAMALTGRGSGLAVVNYEKTPAQLAIRPLLLEAAANYRLIEQKTGAVIKEGPGKDFTEIRISVPGTDFILLNLTNKQKQ